MGCLSLVQILIIQSFAIIVAMENIMKPDMLSIPPNNHGIQPTVLIKEEIKVFKGNLLTIIPKLSTEWSVSLNVRIAQNANSAWTNLIRFTEDPSSDGRHLVYGMRTPLAGFGASSEIFHICSSVNGNSNYAFDHGNINLNQTYILEIHQRYVANGEYRYYVTVDGVEVHSVVNTDARQFYNVRVYASGPYQNAPDAYISDFEYVNFL